MLLSRTRKIIATSNAAAQNSSKAIADSRTNSVLLTGDPGSRLRYKTLISHLDTPLESGSTQVIYLHYAQADSLVAILEKVANTGNEEGGEAS